MPPREVLYENFKNNRTLIVTFQAHADKIFASPVEDVKAMLNSLASMGYDVLKMDDTNDSFFFQGIGLRSQFFDDITQHKRIKFF